jgi:hypothetical protein
MYIAVTREKTLDFLLCLSIIQDYDLIH